MLKNLERFYHSFRQFHQHLRARTKFWRQSQNITRKAAKKDVCTKKARKNVDEIDTLSSFQVQGHPFLGRER